MARERLSHQKLDAYRIARSFAVDLFQEARSFPTEERFGLTLQIRRAAVSIPANIAEGAARKSKKEFVQFLSTARGSSAELRLLLEIAHETGMFRPESYDRHAQTVDRISSMISGLMKRNES